MPNDPLSQPITRRAAIGLLGAGAALAAKESSGKNLRFPKGAIIRTMLRDVPPEALGGGTTLFHEHLNQHSGGNLKFLEDVDSMIEEVRGAGNDGIRCIVDAGHEDMGRRIEELKRIAVANEGKVYIVASGGYYLQRAYPPEIATKSADQIADDLVLDAQRKHLGAYGEIAQSAEMTPDEHKVFVAVAKAHLRNNLPIFTHNAYMGMRPPSNPPPPRDSALRQLDIFESAGVKPEHVAIGHVCCLNDPEAGISIQLAKRGAYVGFDRVNETILPNALRAKMALKILEAGHADKLLLSSDYAFEDQLRKNGGPGLSLTLVRVVPLLRQAGVSEETLHGILVDNPRRFLAFVPKKAARG